MNCKLLSYLIVIILLFPTLSSCEDDGDDPAKEVKFEMGDISARRQTVYTGQTLSLSVDLGEYVMKHPSSVIDYGWSIHYGDSVVEKKGKMTDATCLVTDTVPLVACKCCYEFSLEIDYYGQRIRASKKHEVGVMASDILNSVWGETPEETMLSVPIHKNFNTGRYEYTEPKDPNTLWSYEYVNGKLFKIYNLSRRFNETDSMCMARFLNMYIDLKAHFGAPEKGDDSGVMERILDSRTNDSLYNYCMRYYGECLHQGKIKVSDSTYQRFSLHVTFLNSRSRVDLFAMQDSVSASQKGIYYSREYSYRLK